MKRPLGFVALFYVAGLLLGYFIQPPLPLLFALSFAFCLAALRFNRIRHYLIWPLIIFAGWTNLVSRTAVLSPHDLRHLLTEEAEIVSVRGTLPERLTERVYVRGETESSRALARLNVTALQRRSGWQPAHGQIVVTTFGSAPPEFFAGQEVEITGVISPPPSPPAEGLFDYRAYLRNQGIYFQLKAGSFSNWKLLSDRKRPLTDRFLTWAQTNLARGLPERDEPLRLTWAMTLGWRSALTDEVYEPFIQSGTMHIFAISGLHIALIAAILLSLLRVVRVSRLWCGLIVIPLIWFYTAATGWQPSAVRASTMMSIVLLGWMLKRPSELLNSLATAALIILLWDPRQLFQAGFQLSFFVVVCLALFLPPLEKIRDRILKTDPLLPAELVPRWRRWLNVPARFFLTCLATSIAAWLGSWLLTAYYFHVFSPVTLLANVMIVPMAGCALASNLGSLACGGWLPAAAELFNHSGWFWMKLMMSASHWSAAQPGSHFYVGRPPLAAFGFYYLLLFGALGGWLLRKPYRRWIWGGIGIATLWCAWQWQQHRQATELTVIPAGGGAAIFFRSPEHPRGLLIDCGSTNVVESVTKPFLRARGVNHLPQLVLTHGDMKRMGGVAALDQTLTIGEIVTSSARFRSPVYRRFLKELQNTPERRREMNRGDSLGAWTVLHPEPNDNFSQGDDGALVLRGEFMGTRVLLLSDLGRHGQEAIMARTADLRADIVVSGLPERGEPLSDALLDVIDPKLIVITDSEYPATRRASPLLRARLTQRGVPVIFTRQTGSLKISFTQADWKLRAMDGFELSGSRASHGPGIGE